MTHALKLATNDVIVASSSSSSGLRPRTVSPTAPTVEMPSPTAATREMLGVSPVVSARRKRLREPTIEHTSLPARRPSNDAGESQDLINNSDHRSTRYCFIAPRSGHR